MNKSLKELIKKADFTQVKHVVVFRNDTSGTTVADESFVYIEQILEKGLVLHVPNKACMQGHNLTLFMLRIPLRQKIEKIPERGTIKNSFEVIGKVMEIESHDDEAKECSIIKINFVQFDLRQWREFILSYVEQMEKIEQLQYRYDEDEEA